MSTPGYQLLDSGNHHKLEQVGAYRFIRPSPQAHWKPLLPQEEWDQAVGMYHRNTEGGGQWEWHDVVPEAFEIEVAEHPMLIKPTGFGHFGLFAEQADNWTWLTQRCQALENPKVLNLFGYTGGSTLACARGGAEVTHIDASKGVVEWTRDNAQLQGLEEATIRFIAEDAAKFVKREHKRGKSYDGIILDPPSFGRGPKGEVWKIEEQLNDLLDGCRELFRAAPKFWLLSCHSPNYSPLSLAHLLHERLDLEGKTEFGEMIIPCPGGRDLPSGAFARWWKV